MTRRYYHSELLSEGAIVALCEPESQHALKVMRVQVGDEIELFDGQGRQATAIILETNRRECHCRVETIHVVDREPSTRIHLGVALPKPDRARELIERLTELGVHTLTPIVADRTQRPPSPSLIDKLRRAVTEACKQSERNSLMRIDDPAKTPQVFGFSPNVKRKWIAHPNGDSIQRIDCTQASDVFALIGPEGGWTDSEVDSAVESGFVKISLGKRIYRIETAAVVVAAHLTD